MQSLSHSSNLYFFVSVQYVCVSLFVFVCVFVCYSLLYCSFCGWCRYMENHEANSRPTEASQRLKVRERLRASERQEVHKAHVCIHAITKVCIHVYICSRPEIHRQRLKVHAPGAGIIRDQGQLRMTCRCDREI